MGKVSLEPLTPAVVRLANERGAATASSPNAVVAADVAKIDGTFHLQLQFRDGSRISVPTKRIEELAGARVASLRQLEVAPSRDSIAFPALDVDIFIPGLLDALYGSTILAERGRAGGRRSSPKKTAAVRENGRKGGRPPKKKSGEAA